MTFRLPQLPADFRHSGLSWDKAAQSEFWFGGEISLTCKMKPGHCMTSLFAYFAGFRVVKEYKQVKEPNSFWSLTVNSHEEIYLEAALHKADSAASHLGRFHDLVRILPNLEIKIINLMLQIHSHDLILYVVSLKQCVTYNNMLLLTTRTLPEITHYNYRSNRPQNPNSNTFNTWPVAVGFVNMSIPHIQRQI